MAEAPPLSSRVDLRSAAPLYASQGLSEQVEEEGDCTAPISYWECAKMEPDLEAREPLCKALPERDADRLGLQLIRLTSPSVAQKVVAEPPAKFDDRDKEISLNTWATNVAQHLSLKGQAPETFVGSAVNQLAGSAQQQASLLACEVPQGAWTSSAWDDAMQSKLCQNMSTSHVCGCTMLA